MEPTADVILRRAESSDENGLAAVYLASAHHHADLDPAAYRVPEAEIVRAHYRRLLNDDSRAVFVAAAPGGGVVGSVEVRVEAGPPSHSMLRPRPVARVDIAVLPDARGKGVGRLLMRRAEQWAQQHGAGAVLLDMLATNVEARGFYEAVGYREFGTLMIKDPLRAE